MLQPVLTKRKRISVAFVGPSGVGKSSIIRWILRIFFNIKEVISYTSRKPRLRPDGTMEENGIDYWFVAARKFIKLDKEGYFLESSKHHDEWYGTPKDQCTWNTHNLVFDVDVNGAETLKKIIPNLIVFFIKPVSVATLLRRLRKRGSESEEQIQKRVQRYKDKERFYQKKCDYIVVNEDGKFLECFAKIAFTMFTEQGGFMGAIDSLSGAGGGTFAGGLAAEFKGRHVDSGMFYRILAWLLGICRGISPDNADIEAILEHNHKVFDIDAFNPKAKTFRTQDVNKIVHFWAKNKTVREQVFWLIMKAAYCNEDIYVFCEGRDMTSKLFKLAQLRIYLKCSPATRAKRRREQLIKENPELAETLSFNEVLGSINTRDFNDRTREESPFVADTDQTNIVVDNDKLLDFVMNEGRNLVSERMKQKELSTKKRKAVLL